MKKDVHHRGLKYGSKHGHLILKNYPPAPRRSLERNRILTILTVDLVSHEKVATARQKVRLCREAVKERGSRNTATVRDIKDEDGGNFLLSIRRGSPNLGSRERNGHHDTADCSHISGEVALHRNAHMHFLCVRGCLRTLRSAHCLLHSHTASFKPWSRNYSVAGWNFSSRN